jgi:hypothetical protein
VLDTNLLTFSGGMQQKIILARWLLLEPRLLLLDEPTRGVDIGTRASIYALLRQIAATGVACVIVSSDFDEVIGLTDRVIVLSDGVSVTDIPSALVDAEKLAMFAAPRSSAELTHSVLAELVGRFGGVAYWVGLDRERLFCFDRIGDDTAADPGFGAGGFPTLATTRIAHALPPRDDFATTAGGSLPTLLVPVAGRSGHSLGMVGLTLAHLPQNLDVTRLRREIRTALGDDTGMETQRVGTAL